MASGENARAGGARESNHTRGLAIDVQPTPNSMDNYRKMWKLASDNPSFGVCFPFQDHPFRGFPKGDRPHMILAGIGGSEGGKCDAQGVTKPCNGLAVNPKAGVPSGNPDPGASDPGTGDQQPPSTESPTTEEKTDGQVLTQDYQCLLGLNPIYVVTIPAGTPIASLPQCLNNSQAQKPMQCQPLFMCAGNTIVFQDSSCTKQSGQYCQFGCSNGACKQSQQQPNSQGSPPAPSTPSTPGTSGTPNTPASNDAITPSALTQQIASQAGTGGALTPSTLASPGLVANLFKSTSASSSLELLNALANNPSSLTSASPSGTSVVLNSDAQKITELHPPQTPIDTGGVTYARPASSFFTTTNDTPPTPGIIPNTRQSNMSDTFTSRDLATNPTAQPPSNNFSGDTFTSRSLSILSNLKIQLIRLLDFIRTQGNPFSGTIQNQLGEK